MEGTVRIDKWLWAVRIFKTRSMATAACRAGKVEIGQQVVKPSREVRVGETISISLTPLLKTVKVLQLLENRVSAKKAGEFAEDLTPPEEYEKQKRIHETNFENRDRGTGRPTKRQRREIEYLKKIWKE